MNKAFQIIFGVGINVRKKKKIREFLFVYVLIEVQLHPVAKRKRDTEKKENGNILGGGASCTGRLDRQIDVNFLCAISSNNFRSVLPV